MTDEAPQQPAGAPACPHCGAPLGVTPAPARQDVTCPNCGGSIVIPSFDGSIEPVDEPAEQPAARDDELSAARIRQLAAARRAAYRSRSYCVIAALVCVVAAVQLAWNGIALLRATGWGMRPTSYLLFAMLAAWGAVYFFRKAVELDREAKRSALPETTAEPDFTPLSDGTERWKNLEDIR